MLGHNDFKATDGWLSRWKCRFGIKFEKAHGENDSAEQCKSTKLLNLLQKFYTDEIYNVNETGLFYHATLDGSLSYRHATLSGSKAMDRLSVLNRSNTSETDKLKLMVTGERAKPWCFKGISMDSLPILYYANKTVWMT
jgi:hypothetical protein